ncbi:GNAT family N-acetyltransferase [Flammeovirga aprica]|uniref:GNAT family N-acetyltransferase n=1 Tax=Flammeovirga aprica JL-4 TaxID=694437 RepID=A0A7X9P1R3_9BACT|nr:GNAT family N-acetyltransferase [Flammeovirga aprica]NME67825.1 GNAT family N-acetyltransferase [Flammeovirga aprica JL-4]
MNCKYITLEDGLYDKAKSIRIQCFFEGYENAEQLINDSAEKNGIHLVSLNEKGEVTGTGRLNLENTTAIISQMAINPIYQNQGIGGLILDELILKSKSLGVDKIRLSARVTAQSFYSKKGFKEEGEVYPSKKTGIQHVDMVLPLV